MNKETRSLCYGDKDCPHAKRDGATWRCDFTEHCCFRDMDISDASKVHKLEIELSDVSAMLKVVSDQRDAALTLSAFRSALVRHDVIPPESIEDAEGFDGGITLEATRLAFEELTGDATDNKETT